MVYLRQVTLDVSNRRLSVALRESAPLLALSFAQWPVPSRLWSRALRFRPRPGTFLQSHQSFPESEGWQQTLASNILGRQATFCRSTHIAFCFPCQPDATPRELTGDPQPGDRELSR